MTPEEHDQYLLWFKTTPGYRELVRERISEAQKRALYADRVREARATFVPKELDLLGREVEGCG
jgi:hypothetical protein